MDRTSTIVERILITITEDERKNALLGVHMLQNRQREKQELLELNKLLDQFVRQMSNLEAQNNRWINLTKDWEDQLASIKRSFHGEITEGQKELDRAVKSKASIELEIARLRSDLKDYKRRFNLPENPNEDINIGTYANELETKIRQTDNQLQSVSREAATLEEEIRILLINKERLVVELKRVKDELDRERLKSLEFDNRMDFYNKKYEFLKNEFAKEFPDRSPGPWPSIIKLVDCRKIAASVREISGEFDDWARENRTELDWLRNVKVNSVHPYLDEIFKEEKIRVTLEIERYREKVTRSKAENERLKKNYTEFKKKVLEEREKYINEMKQMESKFQSLLNENSPLQNDLKVLLSANHSLKAELAIYRKMIGGQRNFSPPQPSPTLPIPPSPPSPGHQRGEVIVHTFFEQESHGCKIRFTEVPYDGKYIVLKNYGNEDEKIDSWKLIQNNQILFKFSPEFVLKAGESTKIWHKMRDVTASRDEQFFEATLWGDGRTALTITLLNKHDELKVKYNQSTKKDAPIIFPEFEIGRNVTD